MVVEWDGIASVVDVHPLVGRKDSDQVVLHGPEGLGRVADAAEGQRCVSSGVLQYDLVPARMLSFDTILIIYKMESYNGRILPG